jgi:hypothetical protein
VNVCTFACRSALSYFIVSVGQSHFKGRPDPDKI